MTTPTQPDPAAELRAAAESVRNGNAAIAESNLAWAIAEWLERAARHEDATAYAAVACWPDDKDRAEREAWEASMVGHEALAVARAILGGRP